MDGRIEVVSGPVHVVEVPSAEVVVVEVASVAGPTGPMGPAGDSSSVAFEINIPTATWVIPVPLGIGRVPGVAVYVDGQLVIVETHASDTQVSVLFPSPMTGVVVLT